MNTKKVKLAVKTFIKKHHFLYNSCMKFIIIKNKLLYPFIWKKREVVNRRGIETESIPYIIRRSSQSVGLFSYLVTNLSQINYAANEGGVPVIDMKNYANSYLYDDEVGKINSWEYYFLQPTKLSLEEAYKAKRYVLSEGIGKEIAPSVSMSFFNNTNGELDYWKCIYNKYIKIQPHVLEILNDEKDKLFDWEKDKVLAVLCRGTDYFALKPHNHPIQPKPEDVINDAQLIMSEYGFNKIFLATEDVGIYELFKKYFGEKVIINNKTFKKYGGKGVISNCESDRKADRYMSGLEYLTTIYIASKCHGFLSGRVNGAIGIMLMSNGFEYTRFYDLGVY